MLELWKVRRVQGATFARLVGRVGDTEEARELAEATGPGRYRVCTPAGDCAARLHVPDGSPAVIKFPGGG